MTRPVVIIGAGPAGLACALALRQAGVPALLLERGRHPREKPCAGGLGGRGEAVLAALGALPTDEEVPAARVWAASLQGALRFRRIEPGGPVGRVIRRPTFDAFLAARAVAAGAVLGEGCAVDGVVEEADRVVVSYTQGGQARTVEGVVAVGADGVGSVVRRGLGLGRGLPWAQVVEVDTAPLASDRPRDELAFDVSDHRYPGYAWDFPTIVDGHAAVCRGVYVLRLHEGGALPDPGPLLDERLRALGARPLGGKVKRYAERGYAHGATISSARRLLIGEAIGIDPVTGEGIAQALEGGAAAGKYLAASLGAAAPCAAWSATFARSRLGRDLAIRAAGARPFFGRSRAAVEEVLFGDEALLLGATRHFAGLPQDGSALGALAGGLAAGVAYKARAALSGLRGARGTA